VLVLVGVQASASCLHRGKLKLELQRTNDEEDLAPFPGKFDFRVAAVGEIVSSIFSLWNYLVNFAICLPEISPHAKAQNHSDNFGGQLFLEWRALIVTWPVV
jgi:hypothetical protein